MGVDFVQRTPLDGTPSSCLSNKSVMILFWDSYWIWPTYGLGPENVGFLEHKCQCANCYVSTDKSKSTIADAVVISWTNSAWKQY